jgi:hypothetical protein
MSHLKIFFLKFSNYYAEIAKIAFLAFSSIFISSYNLAIWQRICLTVYQTTENGILMVQWCKRHRQNYMTTLLDGNVNWFASIDWPLSVSMQPFGNLD